MDQGKKSLIALIFVFVAPVILGTALFFNKEKLGLGSSTVNYGTLINPAKPTSIDGLMISEEAATMNKVLSKKWTLLFITANDCDALCMDRLLLMKRVRLLMNEDMRRIRTTLVSSSKTLESSLKADNPDLVFAHTNSSSNPFFKQFETSKETRPIYLLDPLGNLMMLYPQAEPDHKMMIKDLKRLLKYSRLG